MLKDGKVERFLWTKTAFENSMDLEPPVLQATDSVGAGPSSRGLLYVCGYLSIFIDILESPSAESVVDGFCIRRKCSSFGLFRASF